MKIYFSILLLIFSFALILQGGCCRQSPEERNKSFVTAIYDGKINEVKRLLKTGIKVDVSNGALRLAATHGKTEIVKLLIENGADINNQDSFGCTALMCSVGSAFSSLETAKTLFKAGADINKKDMIGQTALHSATTFFTSDYIDIVMLLLDNGAKINMRNENGETTLFTAAKNENHRIFGLFIDKGANSKIKNKDGKNVLEAVNKFLTGIGEKPLSDFYRLKMNSGN